MGTSEYTKQWREDNPGKVKGYQEIKKQRRQEKAVEINFRQRLARYGLTLEDFEYLVSRSEGFCEICGADFEVTRDYIDHNHITGKVRGLLCNRCNMGLSYLEDPDWCIRANDYLGLYD